MGDAAEDDAAVDVRSMQDLRLLVSCWAAYARRWVQAPPAKATAKKKQGKQKSIEAYLVDDAFELELTNFHALVVHTVACESALEYPRASLERRLRAWSGMEMRVRDWWLPLADRALACLADLQLVVPGVWIGSAATLQHADAIARKKIAHVVHCAVAVVKKSTADASQQQQVTPVVQVVSPTFPSTFAYTITLSEVPQLEYLHGERLSAESEDASLATWEELEAASKFLLGILRLQDKFAAAVSSVDPDEADTSASVLSSVEMGLLLYCDSGISTSIAVCAALLMYRFCLPLRHAMRLLRSARRFIAPSTYLQRQLELYEEELNRRRHGLQHLSLHQSPA